MADSLLSHVELVYLAIAVSLACVVGYARWLWFSGRQQVTVNLDLGDFADGETVHPDLPPLSVELPPWNAFEQWRLETELAMPSPWNCPLDAAEIGAGDA